MTAPQEVEVSPDHEFSVGMSDALIDGLNQIGLGKFFGLETPERMAWVVLILRELDDRPEWFPRGKWATIQWIEESLHRIAKSAARARNAVP
jgi:hypothetical protein